MQEEQRSYSNASDSGIVLFAPRYRFVDRLIPPSGAVCAPFWRFTYVTGCPLGCHYCFLQLTLRFQPEVRVGTNISDGVKEAERVLRRAAEIEMCIMFNAGELGDGRLYAHQVRLAEQFFPLLERWPNGRLYLLSKTGLNTIGDFLAYSGPAVRQVVHAASVNPQVVIDQTEEHTAPLAERLEALRRLRDAGYRIRVRIDPIFDLRNWGASEAEAFGVYEELAEEVGELKPEMVTLGSYRPDPNLTRFIARNYPDSPVLRARTVRGEGRKRRLPARVEFYQRLVPKLQAAGTRVALCKEPVRVWHAVGLSPDPLECSCLPLKEERKGA